MLVGRCLNTNSTTPASRSKSCSQRCCAFISSTGHQQAQVAQAAARTSATSEVCQSGISAPVAGHLSGLYQLLEAPRSELSVQAQLNDRLKHCNTWEELAALLEANIDIVDFVNVSTAWTRLAKLFESTGPHKRDGLSASGAAPVREPAFRRFLARLIDTTSQQLRLFGVQALANVMWALSNADWQLEQYEPAVDKLMHEWCASVHNRLPELRAPDVSNISTSIGRLDHRWRPEFIVEFYRSVLHRADLLEQLDLTTLNNLLYGLSRAGCRGLIHMGPASRRLLAQCVDRILERPDREAVGLVPWRAAQLLYNCHKFKLRVRSHLYGVLMPVVAEVYTCEPNPMDCWSMGFLTAFVAAHRRVHPTARPDLRPLYAYMERRLPEASTSQLAMLAHAFRELGCPAPASFWGQVFSRYMGEPLIHSVPVPAPVPPHPAAVSSGLVQQQQQQPPQQQQLPQQRAAEQLIQQRQRPPHASQLLGLQPQQRMTAESADGRILTAEQLHSSQGLQHGGEPPAKTQAQVLVPPKPSTQQLQRQHSLLSRQHQAQLQLQVQCHQQQAAQALQQQQMPQPQRAAERGVGCGEPVGAHSYPQEPYRGSHVHRPAALNSAQQSHHQLPQPAVRRLPGHSVPQQQSQQQQQQPQQQLQEQQQQLRRPLPQQHPTERPDWVTQQHQQRQEPQQQQPQANLPQRTSRSLEWPQQHQDGAAGPILQQQQQQQQQQRAQQLNAPHPHSSQPHSPHPRASPDPPPHPHLHPRPHHPRPGGRSLQSTDQTALAVAGPAAFQPPRLVNSSMAVAATVSLPMHPDDDLAEPRTLHYVCWQAAKAGILPPRAFLRLYVERVPQWLVHSADDTQVAQAVETLKLLRWVPRRELRDMLCATLKRRAATSRLPMRSLLRWVRQQR